MTVFKAFCFFVSLCDKSFFFFLIKDVAFALEKEIRPLVSGKVVLG